MAGLPLHLYTRCRTVLLQCNEFDSQSSLRAVFAVAELSPFQDSLPDAPNRADRVTGIMDYLLPRYLSNGQSAFLLFLAALHVRQHEEDLLCRELADLRSEIEQGMGHITPVNIPFVILAMTRAEATHLVTEGVFSDPEIPSAACTRLRQFEVALEKQGITDLPSHYGNHREDWRPYPCSQQAISDVIQNTIAHINQWRHSARPLSPIYPQFFSIDFFADDGATRRQTWHRLGQSGCVLIIDAVSLFHPALHQTLLHSGASSNDRVAIFVLSPVNSNALEVNQLIEQEIGSHLEVAFVRFDEHLDKLCEFGVGGLRALQRWISAIVPEVEEIARSQRPDPTRRSVIRETLGEPQGMDQVIFGQRGR